MRERGEGLTDYYAASGNPPGRWIGQGCVDLDVDGVVTEEQMKALFGEGRHPRADEILERLIGEGVPAQVALEATQLGRKLPVYANEPDMYDKWLQSAFARFERDHGRAPEVGVESDLIKDTVARKYLAKTRPDQVVDDVAVRRFMAERGAKQRQPVSGYDMVFTPAKSVSVLWGLADRDVSRQIEQAHEAAWKGALAWAEKQTALTRKGAGGIAQINTTGLVATAFDHIDSRAGDPNLHTHVAIANRVKGVDGKWRALDARPLHKFMVATSETYNLLLEHELTSRLGVQFEDVYTRRGGQAVREIVGIDKELREMFSQRSQAIESHAEDLVNDYKARHGVMPSKVTQVKLAQEATLATRQGKEEGVTLLARREQWTARVIAKFGPEISEKLVSVLRPRPAAVLTLDSDQVDELSRQVVANLSQGRARWHYAHTAAEANRVLRTYMATHQITGHATDVVAAVDQVALRAHDTHSVSLEAPEMLVRPALLSRVDGSSQFRVHGAQWRTSSAVLDREDALLVAGRTSMGPVFDPSNVELVSQLSARPLDAGQLGVAQRFVTSGRLLDAGIGAAGTGKTTAMMAFARAVEMGGGRVIALAPSAVAAKVLQDEISVPAWTVASFLLSQEAIAQRTAKGEEVSPDNVKRLGPDTLILVDEAGMTDAGDIAKIVEYARANGAGVRLLGDPAQLDAVTGAGALRMFDREIGAAKLSAVHRFSDPLEAVATLALREGDVKAAEFYISNGRVLGGTHAEVLDRIYRTWWNDTHGGVDAVMVAYANDDVRTLAQRAQADRVAAGEVLLTDVQLRDGSLLGVGDHVVTRRNNQANSTADGSFVKNGDVWTVNGINERGHVLVEHHDTGAQVVLDPEYVAAHVELAYASTIHRVQGRTVDHSYVLMDDSMTREQLYVALTRGRHYNGLFMATDKVIDPDGHSPVPDSDSAAAMLRRAIGREGAELSALETFQREIEAHESLAVMLGQYEYAQSLVKRSIDPEHVRDVVMAAYGGSGNYVTSDAQAWPAVMRLVDDLERTGIDPVKRLAGAARAGELASDGSAGRLLVERAGEIGPGRRSGIEDLDVWLAGMEERIKTRLATHDLVELPGERDLGAIRRAWNVKAPVVDVSPTAVSDASEATVAPVPAPVVAAGPTAMSTDAVPTRSQRLAELLQAQHTDEVPIEADEVPLTRSQRLARLAAPTIPQGLIKGALDAASELERKDVPEIE